jgi:hypothetical protein
MKQNESVNMTRAEEIYLGLLSVLVLIILPLWCAEAMFLGAGAGLLAYTLVFRDRIRRRGWLIAVVPVSVAAVLGAAIAAALARGH